MRALGPSARLSFIVVQCKEDVKWQKAFTKSSRSLAPAPRPGRGLLLPPWRASQTLRDLRVAEVCEQDVTISDGKIEFYRVRMKLSFKFED